MMFDEMTARSDLEGRRVWQRVGEAINELQGARPRAMDAHVHLEHLFFALPCFQKRLPRIGFGRES